MIFGSFRTVSDDFGPFSARFRTTPLKILKFQISIGQGWGPSEPFRPSEPSRPSPGQLKFEILRKNRQNRTKTAEKERTKTKKEKMLKLLFVKTTASCHYYRKWPLEISMDPNMFRTNVFRTCSDRTLFLVI